MGFGSELTWFEKGLRHFSPAVNVYIEMEWIDLIWEGITTCWPVHSIVCWPKSELTWFEKGLRLGLPCHGIILFRSELTWFEKGLRQRPVWPFWISRKASELTWFEKGLRHWILLLSSHQSFLEWIDLIWEGITTSFPDAIGYILGIEWIDLIWEGITTPIMDCASVTITTGVNWPDLRRDYDNPYQTPDQRNLSFPSELTWFEKGLRPFQIQAILFKFRPWVNWPDLRRDYDRSTALGFR